MKQVLHKEIAKERCNAKALGAFNGAVSFSKKSESEKKEIISSLGNEASQVGLPRNPAQVSDFNSITRKIGFSESLNLRKAFIDSYDSETRKRAMKGARDRFESLNR